MTIHYQTLLPKQLPNYFDSYLKTINNLVPAGKQTKQQMQANLQQMINQGSSIFVAIDTDNDEIIGTVTVLIEQKLTRGGAKAAHIEELITREDWNGKGIGTQLVQMAVDHAKQQGCYKIIGDTKKELVPWFEKRGFDAPEIMIRKYLD